MTDVNRHADPDDWNEVVTHSIAHELDAHSRRGGSAMRTAAVAVVAFGMGALAATAVLATRGSAPETPLLASTAPDPVETAASLLRAPEAVDVASESTVEDEPARTVAAGPDDAPPPRPVRDVTVEPSVDRAALSQDSIRAAERLVPPALEAQQSEERAAAEPELEPSAADRQDVGMAPRSDDIRPSLDAPAEEVPASAQAELLPGIPPEPASAPSEPAAAPASARVKSAVSMRSGPDKGTEVVGVVPADVPVQVLSCDGWCEVVYNGQRGYVYKTFLDGAS